MIFYEAPHKLVKTLEDMLAVWGDREIALCRELTKLHEACIRTTLSGALELYRETPPRGEYVLVIAGAPEAETAEITPEAALELVEACRAAGCTLKEACRRVSGETGLSRNELYNLAVGK